MKVAKLSAAHLDRFYGALSDEGLRPATVRRCMP